MQQKKIIILIITGCFFLLAAYCPSFADVFNADPADLKEKIDKYTINREREEMPSSVYYIDFDAGDDKNSGTREKPWKRHPWDPEAENIPAKIKGAHTYVFKKGVVYEGALHSIESGKNGKQIIFTSDSSWGTGNAIIAGSARITGKWKKCSAELFPELPRHAVDKIWYTEWKNNFIPRTMTEIKNNIASGMRLSRFPDFDQALHLNSDDPRSAWREMQIMVNEVIIEVESSAGFSAGDKVQGGGKWVDKDEDRLNIAAGENLITAVDNNKIIIEIFRYKKGEFIKGSVIENGKARTVIKSINSSHDQISRIRDSAFEGINEYWTSGTIWMENNLGVWPQAAKIIRVDSQKKEISFAAHQSLDSTPAKFSRFYLENIPGFLDQPGEFYFNNKQQQLFIRPNHDSDPNQLVLLTGKYEYCIFLTNCSDITIQNLYFTGCNDVIIGEGAGNNYHRYRHKLFHNSGVLAKGNINNLTISNCIFESLPAGISGAACLQENKDLGVIDKVSILNCAFSNIDSSAIQFDRGWYTVLGSANGRIRHIIVSNNSVYNTGYRNAQLWGGGKDAIGIYSVEMAEITANNITRSHGCGIHVIGPEYYDLAKLDYPLQRVLIHHNYIEDAVLASQDYGAIAPWHGGPMYVFCNTIINPVGYKHTGYKNYFGIKTNWYRTTCYGVGIYADQGYKVYTFNNLVIGKSGNVNDKIYNSSAYNEAQGFLNSVFNNTFYRFGIGLHRGMNGFNRCVYLNNLMLEIGCSFIGQEPKPDTIEYNSLAYGYNLMNGPVYTFGYLPAAEEFKTLDDWKLNLVEKNALLSQTGWISASSSIIKNAGKHDFTPLAGSPVIDQAKKVFVPWGLYRTGSEWHFHKTVSAEYVFDEHLNWNKDWKSRDSVWKKEGGSPRNDLRLFNFKPDDFLYGQLEDWIESALHFNGKNTYAEFISSDAMEMDGKNFLIETVIRTGSKGPLSGKMENSASIGKGYLLVILESGQAGFFLNSAGKEYFLVKSSSAINDGNWHHIIAETDRSLKKARLYIDGRDQTGVVTGSFPQGSLKNEGIFMTGRYGDKYFEGDIDFLRISRGTLADAETTIEELYNWQFNGPFLRDFFGKKPEGKRDIGAVEFTK